MKLNKFDLQIITNPIFMVSGIFLKLIAPILSAIYSINYCLSNFVKGNNTPNFIVVMAITTIAAMLIPYLLGTWMIKISQHYSVLTKKAITNHCKTDTEIIDFVNREGK